MSPAQQAFDLGRFFFRYMIPHAQEFDTLSLWHHCYASMPAVTLFTIHGVLLLIPMPQE